MKKWIEHTVESVETRQGRLFAITIQSLIIVSLITFSISTLPNLSESAKQVLHAIEVATVSIFTIEYILRIYVSKQRLKFFFSFYGLIDLIAILPFYIASGLDLSP